MSSSLAFNFDSVTKTYDGSAPALQDVSVSVEEGEFVFLAGASGAGKSTLLKILLGFETFSEGEVVVLDRDMSALNKSDLPELRREMGVIFQDYKLLKSRTVLDNVAFALEMQGVSRREREGIAYKLLASLGLRDKAHSFPMSLSGGEQQRVAVARALVLKPKLILADEPTGNLDPDMTYAVFNLLLEANKCGATVFIASHNIPLIEELNKRTIVLKQGKVIGDFSQVR